MMSLRFETLFANTSRTVDSKFMSPATVRVFRKVVKNRRIDIVLMDLNLPGEDGLVLTRQLRAAHSMGIIMITAAGQTVDRIVGLEMGADDYIAKPFDLREVLARIRSLLRRMRDRPRVSPDASKRQAGDGENGNLRSRSGCASAV